MRTSHAPRVLGCIGGFLVIVSSVAGDVLTYITDIRRCTASYSGNGSATTTESRREPFGPFEGGADISCTNGLETWTAHADQVSGMDAHSISFAGAASALIVASPLSGPLQALGQSKLDVFFTIDATASYVLAGHVSGSGHAESVTRVVLSRYVDDESRAIETIAAPDDGFGEYRRIGILQPGMYRLQAEATAVCRTNPPEVGAGAQTSCAMEFRAESIPCPADWDADGRVGSGDLFAFLNDFFGAGVDFNGDGESNSIDLFEFLAQFLSGC